MPDLLHVSDRLVGGGGLQRQHLVPHDGPLLDGPVAVLRPPLRKVTVAPLVIAGHAGAGCRFCARPSSWQQLSPEAPLQQVHGLMGVGRRDVGAQRRAVHVQRRLGQCGTRPGRVPHDLQHHVGVENRAGSSSPRRDRSCPRRSRGCPPGPRHHARSPAPWGAGAQAGALAAHGRIRLSRVGVFMVAGTDPHLLRRSLTLALRGWAPDGPMVPGRPWRADRLPSSPQSRPVVARGTGARPAGWVGGGVLGVRRASGTVEQPWS